MADTITRRASENSHRNFLVQVLSDFRWVLSGSMGEGREMLPNRADMAEWNRTLSMRRILTPRGGGGGLSVLSVAGASGQRFGTGAFPKQPPTSQSAFINSARAYSTSDHFRSPKCAASRGAIWEQLWEPIAGPDPKAQNSEGFKQRNGGAGGIRTLDTGLPYTHFPGVRLRPLGHCSAFPFALPLRCLSAGVS